MPPAGAIMSRLPRGVWRFACVAWRRRRSARELLAVRHMGLVAGLAIWLCCWGAGHAEPPDSASQFVRQVGGEMPKLLAGTKNVDERRVRLLPFVTRVVDTDAVARYCLDYYWNRATPRQRQDFQALFVNVVVNMIATWTNEKLGTGLQANVVMQTPVAHPDGTYVPTIVQAGGAPPVHVTWVVNMQDNPPRLLDVMAEGLSVRVTERSDFMSYLRHHDGDLDGLIGVLRQRARDTGGMLTAAGR